MVTPWNRSRSEKLIGLVVQLGNKSPTFYLTRKLITAEETSVHNVGDCDWDDRNCNCGDGNVDGYVKDDDNGSDHEKQFYDTLRGVSYLYLWVYHMPLVEGSLKILSGDLKCSFNLMAATVSISCVLWFVEIIMYTCPVLLHISEYFILGHTVFRLAISALDPCSLSPWRRSTQISGDSDESSGTK